MVIELFTSQGCSSCPPAEHLFAKLVGAGSVADRAVAGLSFHVDYWNGGGWSDPYSLPAWTERQRQYANALKDDRVYTPEIVVGGATGMVGSNRGAVTQAIQSADRPALLMATTSWAPNALTVTTTAPSDANVWVAVWEDATPTKVRGGENAGETLVNDHSVRRLKMVAAAGRTGSETIPIDPAWRSVGAIAFAQRSDLRITASALLTR